MPGLDIEHFYFGVDNNHEWTVWDVDGSRLIRVEAECQEDRAETGSCRCEALIGKSVRLMVRRLERQYQSLEEEQ